MPATCGGRFEQVQTLIIMSCIDGCTHVCIYAELSWHIKRTGVLPLWSVKNCRREDSGWVNYFDKHALKWVDGRAPEATVGGGQTVNTLVGFVKSIDAPLIYLFIYGQGPLSKLNADVLHEIIGYLVASPGSLASLAQVRREWAAPAQKALYTFVSLRSGKQMAKFLGAIASHLVCRHKFQRTMPLHLLVRHVTLHPLLYTRQAAYLELFSVILPLLQNMESLGYIMTSFDLSRMPAAFMRTLPHLTPRSLNSIRFFVRDLVFVRLRLP
jgi:hypothetical protein